MPHLAAHGGAIALPARNGAAIPKPHSVIHRGVSGSTSRLRRAHSSKKASGTDAAQFLPTVVLVPMPESVLASAPTATGDIDMDDTHHLLDKIRPGCVRDFFAVISIVKSESIIVSLLGQE